MYRPASALLVAAALVGCSPSHESLVRTRSAAEFDCDEARVNVAPTGDGEHYRASGCGHSARYAIHPPGECKDGSCPFK